MMLVFRTVGSAPLLCGGTILNSTVPQQTYVHTVSHSQRYVIAPIIPIFHEVRVAEWLLTPTSSEPILDMFITKGMKG